MTDGCGDCLWKAPIVVGFYEYEGHLIDKERFECRRYPPTVTFLGAVFPRADRRCGEFLQKDTPND